MVIVSGKIYVEEALAALADVEATLAERIGGAVVDLRAGLQADWGSPVTLPARRSARHQ